MKLVLFASLAFAAAATSAVALDGPEETVKRIYAMEDWHTRAQGPDTFLARDMVEAFRNDLKTEEPAPASDMDWRYGGNADYDVSELVVEPGVAVASPRGQTWMDVTVRYKDFNQPKTVVWRMCLASRGWRVADVQGEYAPGARWSVRQDWRLREDRVKC
jgi:hypothetical protein